MAKTLDYRADIDGLRAIAVLAVVIFHLGFKPLEGGFLGVDVFFVISGFLITAILERRVENKALSFKDFYLGRVRRLMPALFATIAATMVAAYFIMSPPDLSAFAGSAIASLLSVSNILFYSQAGYWDTASELKPLLHTWSLGVEEQFYLFWPIFVFLIFKYARGFAGFLFLLVTALGTLVSQYFVTTDPSAAFFMFPLRIFEFSAGALTIYIARLGLVQRIIANALTANTLFAISLAGLAATIWIYDGTTPFPGFMALPPIIATMGLLIFGQSALGSIALANPVSVWIGRVSYSMYLVHWPIIALYRYENGLHLDLTDQAILAAATLIATVVLYYAFEGFFRVKTNKVGRRRPLNSTGFALATLACGYGLTLTNGYAMTSGGMPWRLSTEILTYQENHLRGIADRRQSARRDLCDDPDGIVCGVFAPGQKNVLILADSKGDDALNMLQAAYPDRNFQISMLGGCPLLVEAKGSVSNPRECQAFNDKRFAALQQLNPDDYEAIIISFRITETRARKMAATLERLKAYGFDNIVIVGPSVIYAREARETLLNQMSLKAAESAIRASIEDNLDSRIKAMEEVAAQYGVGVIQLAEILCSGPDACDVFTPRNDLIVYDKNHFSVEGARMLGRRLGRRTPDLSRFLESPSGG